MSKDAARAEELMRSYNYVRRFVGVSWQGEHGRVVLSQPEFPPSHFASLARLLLQPEHPSTAALATAIGAREVFDITPGHLGKGWFHLGALERSDVQRLVDEGVRPLRSLRGRDVDALTASFRAALEAAQQPPVRPSNLTERLEVLFGNVGGRIAERFERATAPSARPPAAQQLLDEFVRTAERVARNEGPAEQRLRPLWTALAKLPAEPVARARALVSCLREFAGGSKPHELGRRRTLEASVRGLPLVPAARRLVAASTPPDDEEPPAELTAAQRTNLLELALLTRHMALDLPRDPEVADLLLFIVEGRPDAAVDELETLWRGVIDKPPATVGGNRHVLRNSALPAALLVEALDLDVLYVVWKFEDATQLRTYLEAVRQLRDDPIANIRPTDDWFVRPFTSGFSWEPALMLGLMANHRKDPEVLVATLGAVQGSQLADFGFSEAFAQWADPVLHDRPALFDAVGEALDLTVSALERYVCWRRLAGYDADFSDTVLKPIQQAEREDRELAHLLGLEQTPSITKRIASLQDADRRAERLESAARRARNAFDRALEVLRRESLDAVLDRVTRAAFERLLGRTLRGSLPPRLRSLMLLLSADNVDPDAIRALLEDVLAQRDLAERPANRRWLDTMRARGVDTDRWLRGIDVEVTVGDEVLRVQTETDPLHVLEMGSYFDTCLSLESGFNAASTLTNAIDANKQVLYGRRADGTVVARKLLAATDDGTLLGYRTYAFEHQRRLAAQLSAAIEAFATECGLRLGAEGQPTALHDTFWYDDGVVPWRLRPTVELPDDIPDDEVAMAEYAYWQGFEDPQWWQWGASLDEYHWSPICAALAFDGSHAADLPREARTFLAARGSFEWLASGEVHPWDDLREVVSVLPARPDAARAFVQAMRGSGGNRPREWAELHAIPPALAVLSPAEVASYVVDHIRLARHLQVECFVDHHDDCIAGFARDCADVLHASWLHAGGGDVDRLFASRDPLVQQVGIELAQRVTSPEIARRLRAILKQRDPEPDLVWALARQGDSASIWALESALEAQPDTEIEAALAVFHPEVGQWPELPQDPSATLSRGQTLRFRHELFELEPRAVGHALHRHGHARLGLVALALDGDALTPIWEHIDVYTTDYQLLPMRELFRRAPPSVPLMSVGRVQENWLAAQLFVDDVELWRRYLDELASEEPRRAMALADILARSVAPADFEAIVHELWTTHEDVFVADAAGVIESLMADWPSDCVSYRLVELFIDWVAPRTDLDPTPYVEKMLRAEWVLDRWKRATTG